jgi:hypothetical protein
MSSYGIGRDEERVDFLPREIRESRVDVAFAAGMLPVRDGIHYVICPTGKSVVSRKKPVHPLAKKYFACAVGQIKSTHCRVPFLKGAFRDRHGRGAGCGGRGRADETGGADRGRQCRVVLAPRRWCQVGRKKFRRRRWQESPVTGESTK